MERLPQCYGFTPCYTGRKVFHNDGATVNERDIARLLAARENGTCEVKTPVGFIDVLTATAVYEVKEVSQWKAAVGQVLAYARYYPNHKPKVYLYGKSSGKQKAIIQEHCAALHVQVIWHQEPKPDDPLSVAVPKPATIASDDLSLLISVYDHVYEIRSTCTVWIALPEAALTHSALQTYLDEAYTIFDNLLDNELTITLQYRYHGERLSLQRHRKNMAAVNQSPICYRLNLSIMTDRAIPIRLSLPGVRRTMPSGQRLERYNYVGATHIPELTALFAFILRPDFRWTNKLGYRATSIQKAHWISYGVKRTRTGWKIGR